MTFGGAPPIPFAGKVAVALVMALLFGYLARRMVGGRPTAGRVAVALVCGFGVLVLLEAALPDRWIGFHDLGIVAALVGAMCGSLAMRAAGRRPDRVTPFCVAMLVGGPAVALALWAALTYDGAPDLPGLGVFFIIGAIAGVIGALAVCAMGIGSGGMRGQPGR